MWGGWIGLRAPASVAAAPSFTSVTSLTAATHKYGIVFQAPKAGDLYRFGLRIGTVTQAPGNGFTMGLQDPDASFDPDETFDAFAVVTAGIVTNGWIETAGFMGAAGTSSGALKSVTAGQIICATIEYASFTAGDSVQMSQIDPQAAPQTYNCYTDAKITGAWVKGTNLRGVPIGLLYDGDTDYTPILALQYVPYTTFTNEAAFGNGSTPDEWALHLTLPYDCTIDGAFFYADIDNAADIVIYDSGGGVLASKSLSSANRTNTNVGENQVSFTPFAYTANTDIYLTLKPTGAGTVQTRTFTVSTNAHMGACEGGSTWYAATRTNAGAWTPLDTKRVWAGLHIASIDSIPTSVTPARVVVGGIAV